MDSGRNQRHAQDHSAELNRRAELYRQAARARESRQSGPRSLRIPHPGTAVFALLSNPRHAPRPARA